MSWPELLRRRAGEYEVLGEWYAERAEADQRYVASADSCVVVAIVLREVAAMAEAEDDEYAL